MIAHREFLQAGRCGVPSTVNACLFDMDGVLTQTARLHAAAWKQMFDQYLTDRDGDSAQLFELPDDYVRYVDGRLREDGVRQFLASRGITLPEGSPGDPPSAETVAGLAARKNALVVEMIKSNGVDVYDASVQFVACVRAAGIPRAVVSASKNCLTVLRAARIEDLFDVRVDGIVAAERQLRGKPAPDMFLAAAQMLGVAPERAAVFEDATAGVKAGSAGGFGWVVGVNRGDNEAALRTAGADCVVRDLGDLLDET
jgi:beta-phosphoglucomutase family hydrolase